MMSAFASWVVVLGILYIALILTYWAIIRGAEIQNRRTGKRIDDIRDGRDSDDDDSRSAR